MTTMINSIGAWIQTRNTLATNLSSVLALLETEPASADPLSDYQKAEAQVDKILMEMRRLALAGLKELDAAAASGGLLDKLAQLSKDAKKEADRLKNAAKTIDGITKAVSSVTEVVTAIAKLPFL